MDMLPRGHFPLSCCGHSTPSHTTNRKATVVQSVISRWSTSQCVLGTLKLLWLRVGDGWAGGSADYPIWTFLMLGPLCVCAGAGLWSPALVWNEESSSTVPCRYEFELQQRCLLSLCDYVLHQFIFIPNTIYTHKRL